MGSDPRPKPGSDDAAAAGCTCPVRENNHGRYAPVPPSGWYVEGGCPMHDPEKLIADGEPPDGEDV